MTLSDVIGKVNAKRIENDYGIKTIQEAQLLSDDKLLKVRGIGRIAISKLRSVRLSSNQTPTDKYKYCNHHHELTDRHKLVDFGDGEFVANVEAIPLLEALAKIGLRTRTHHISNSSEYGFFSIILDGVDLEITTVNEKDSDRYRYDGKKEIIISFKPKHMP